MKSLYLGLLGLALCLLGPGLAHWQLVAPMIGLAIFVASALPAFIALVWGGIVFARHRKRHAMLAASLGLLPLSAIAIPLATHIAAGHPSLNDVSTDLESPPALANGAVYPAEFVPLVREHYSDVTTLAVNATPERALDTAFQLASERPGWTVARVGAHEIRGVAETRIFRFRDDFTIRVRKVDLGAVIDMRSRSRDGKSDLGANAHRIRTFLEELQVRLARREPSDSPP